MAAASLPAWRRLQPGARTLRAFSTAASPTTLPGNPRPRECLPRRLRALGEVRGRNIGPVEAAAVEPAPPGQGRGVPGSAAWRESRACGSARRPGVAPFLAADCCAGASARHEPAPPSRGPALRGRSWGRRHGSLVTALPPRTEKMAVDQDWPSVYPVAAPFKPSAVPLPVRMGYPVKMGVPMAKEGNLELLKALPPRTEKMAVDQDWPSVYPVAAPFKPSAVPLPVRMGYPVKMGVPMAKEGNLELLKIPNFLHLTPVAIKKHCEALKDFCTEWPAALNSDEKCEKHFPIEIDTADYVSAGPSIRNPKARVVTLRVKLSSLNLDDHAKKKLIKLVGERYCKTTDVLTIKTDRCPLKRQNYDYAMYLLTVLYHESWKTEDWEKNKTEADMEEYIWTNSSSEKNILETLLQIKAAEKNLDVTKEELLGTKEIEDYKKCVVSLKNEGDSENTLSQYKDSVKRLLNLT
ncbi:28S ribosomal protein S35, mitochondrial [Myotis davidii]|uniref:28S ribosomal protein S35, mitochondrial n=2 Tax=Myotis davidii TaxID=225400 RepID=L5M694_MYODS|nr:28S ribosomal protein S35, mitochondrial [Myotis davidii]